MSDWADVGRSLLGSWPALASAWGSDAIEAYVEELGRRSLSPDEALVAIRSWEGDTPPNASRVLELARHDPDSPTFDDMVEAVWGQDGVLNPRSSEVRQMRIRIANCSRGCENGWLIDEETRTASPCECRGARRPITEDEQLERAGDFHPLICGFVYKQGVRRLRGLALLDLDNEFREARRKELRQTWREFCEQQDRREVAELVGRPRARLDRGSPKRLDPAAVVGALGGNGGTEEERDDGDND